MSPLSVLTHLTALIAVAEGSSEELDGPVVDVCPLGEFPCGNLSVCLPQLRHCNGVQDCANGADEENCVDNSGWPHLFDAFLKTNIQESKDCMLDVFPEVCHCEGRRLNCNSRELLDVPAVSSNITALELNSNWITSLSPDLFIRYRNLERLHLQNNSIGSISNRAFSGLYHLRKLFLSQNRITTLKMGVFRDLHSLEWLELEGNRISSLLSSSFHECRALTVLALRRNELQMIEEGTFSAMQRLID
ncbi:hypothetical protein AAFF_G00046400, partial [Aldrovandia affinis]